MKGYFAIVVTAGALLLGSATAQYGNPYGYPYGNPYGSDSSAFMYANPYGNQQMMPGAGYYDPMMPGLGYYDPTMDGLGYYDPTMGGMGYYDPMMGGFSSYDPYRPMGFGDPVLAEQLRQGDALMADYQAYFDQLNAQINQYYIDLYRTTTGDQTSPNETALYYGQVIHCQQNPVDCEEAQRISKENLEATRQRSQAIMDALNGE